VTSAEAVYCSFLESDFTLDSYVTPCLLHLNTASRSLGLMIARQGRQHQRYSEDGAREVGVAVIFAIRQSELCVAAVTCRKKADRMTFPKGGWESDESVEQCAMREAIEEAGLVSSLLRPLGCLPPLPHYGKAAPVNLHPVLLSLDTELEEFPEMCERRRAWLPVAAVLSGAVLELKPEFRAILLQVEREVGIPRISSLITAKQCHPPDFAQSNA
jgi:diphosphoinositol-polyphosphate diphosphatase